MHVNIHEMGEHIPDEQHNINKDKQTKQALKYVYMVTPVKSVQVSFNL